MLRMRVFAAKHHLKEKVLTDLNTLERGLWTSMVKQKIKVAEEQTASRVDETEKALAIAEQTASRVTETEKALATAEHTASRVVETEKALTQAQQELAARSSSSSKRFFSFNLLG